MSNTIDDLRVRGQADFQGPVTFTTPIERKYLLQEDLTEFPIDLGDLKINSSGLPLTVTASGSDLALIAGTHGTANLYISAGDCKAATVTCKARFTVKLPPEYVAGEAVALRFSAGMKTTIADTSCTIAAAAYLVGRNTLVSGSNLVTTSATTMNSLTFADKSFTITPTGLNPGDVLDVLVTIVSTDAATGTTVTPAIAAIDLVTSIKG